jgi:hypothetical protein
VVLEVAIVLVGIFAAFRVEEVRDARRARAAEAAQVSALLADFRESRARLEEGMALQREVIDESVRLLHFLEGRDNAPPERIGNVLSFHRFEPVQGAYRAMLSSGDVTRLRNQELAAALATFAADIDAGFEDENESRLMQHDMLSAVSHLGAAVFRTEARARIGLPPLVVPLSEFDNPAFIQALAGHTILESGRLEYYEHLNVRLNEILDLLEAENARAS